MQQIGLVRKETNGDIELEIKRASACGGNCGGCGSSCDSTGHIVVLPNKVNAKVGDLVEVTGDSGSLLKFTAFVYIIPLIFLVVGTVLGSSYFKSKNLEHYELLSLLSGIVFLGLSVLVVRVIDRKVKAEGTNALTVTRLL